MASVVFYFQVHQPFRLKNYGLFSIRSDSDYFGLEADEALNSQIFQKVVNKCYRPATKLLLDQVKKNKDFHLTFSLSGLMIDQLAEQAPDVLKMFQQLTKSGQVELLAETYHHSLASLYSETEFRTQIELHLDKLAKVFKVNPKGFRNTELIYNDEIAKTAEDMGFSVILAEGVPRYLGWRSTNFVYQPTGLKKLKVLLKNFRLSDDIAFRFSNKKWSEWPLTAEKYADWLVQASHDADVINIFIDYETFGEHHWHETGILEFLAQLTQEISNRPELEFKTVSQAAKAYSVKDQISMPETTSWADTERDASAWLDNPLQFQAARTIFDMEDKIIKSKSPQVIEDWRRMTTSDHFYHMSTKDKTDGEVHKYFSPYESAFDAFTRYMTTLHDLRQRV